MRNHWMMLALGAMLCQTMAGAGIESTRPEAFYEGPTMEALADASYRFEGVGNPYGGYERRVGSRRDRLMSRETYMFPGYGSGAESTTPQVQRNPSLNPTISLREMLIPRKARRLFVKSVRALQNGNTTRSTELLEKTIAVHADYFEAQNNLGVRYLETGELVKAVEHLRIAKDLEPSKPEIHTNLGAAYYAAGDFDAAESEAAAAIRLDAQNVKAQRLQELALAARGR